MDKKIKIRVCVGTHCYVMGNQNLKDIKDQLPGDLREKVQVEGAVCLGCEKLTTKPKHPYIEVDGTLIENASLSSVTEYLRKLENKA